MSRATPDPDVLLERVIREHAGGCVVFDADGTLWRGDVGEDFLRFAINRGLFEASYETYERHLALDAARAFGWCVEVMAGLEEAALARTCADFFQARFVGRVFPYVRPLLARLQAAGCPVWICSASPLWTVLPGALALGIPPAQVIGVRCPVVGGRLTGDVEKPVPVGPGKVSWLRRAAIQPVLAVGNGDADVDMLAFATHALVISPPDSRNNLVADAERHGWPILTA